jgi:DNA-binding transcriptional MocR family regulator
VSRNTVAAAYERLTAEGFLVSRVGAGTFVGAGVPDGTRGRAAPAGTAVRPRPGWPTVPPPPRPAAPPVAYDFRVGVPDARLFPLDAWVRRATREYAARRRRLLAGLRGDLARWLEVVPSAAGVHLGALLAAGRAVDVDAVVRLARGAGSPWRASPATTTARPAGPAWCSATARSGSTTSGRASPGWRRRSARPTPADRPSATPAAAR